MNSIEIETRIYQMMTLKKTCPKTVLIQTMASLAMQFV